MKNLVLMGVAGSGKSAAATGLAQLCSCRVTEIDDYVREHARIDVAGLIVAQRQPEALNAQTAACLTLLAALAGSSDQVLVLPPDVCREAAVLDALGTVANAGEAVVVELTADLDTLMRRTGLNAPRTVGFGPLRRTFGKMVEEYRQAWHPLPREIIDTTASQVADIARQLFALTSSSRYPNAD